MTLILKDSVIFTHIPKTGGKSIKNTLKLKGSHTPLFIYQEEKNFNKYYKFTFVRNPWDRLVSTFIFLSKGGYNAHDAISKIILIDTVEGNFSKFVNKLTNINIWQQIHLIPQYFWVTNLQRDLFTVFEHQADNYNLWKEKYNEYRLNIKTLPHICCAEYFYHAYKNNKTSNGIKVLPDFVGRFENMDSDWRKICAAIQYKYKKLPHLNKTVHEHYTDYYDEETRDIVYDIYEKDVDLFGYKYGE